jgi:hypothetical protein
LKFTSKRSNALKLQNSTRFSSSSACTSFRLRQDPDDDFPGSSSPLTTLT